MPDTAISLVSIFRAGHCLFYRQFISAKKEGGIIFFKWGFLILTTTDFIKSDEIHKTYTPPTFSKSYLRQAVWGSKIRELIHLRDLRHQGKEVNRIII